MYVTYRMPSTVLVMMIMIEKTVMHDLAVYVNEFLVCQMVQDLHHFKMAIFDNPVL